jgi:hypothetical protein
VAKTIEALQDGSCTLKVVCLIEGIDIILSDAPEASCQAALAGTDWATSERKEVFVSLANEQRLELWNPFTTGGRCTLRVHDPSDSFQTLVHRRLSGAETVLTQTIDRNDTTINVAGTLNFTAAGDAHIGSECFSYSAKGGTSFTVSQRGKFSPFGCADGGSGGSHFGNHHRKGSDSTHTNLRPMITQLPRTWIGRRVGVWLHTYNAVTGELNSKADAQLVYAGRIVGIADDPATFATVFDLDHLANTDVKNATIGKDLLSGEIVDGLYLWPDRVFTFEDAKALSASAVWTTLTANPLTVVSGTPASVNEIQEGYYTVGELCDRFNAWLGNELANSRIYGHYSWASPVSSNTGMRTKCYWTVNHGTDVLVGWKLTMPGEVATFLGMTTTEGDLRAQQIAIGAKEAKPRANRAYRREGELAPYASLMFYPSEAGRLAQEFGVAAKYELQSSSGEFVDNYAYLPSTIKGSCDASLEWGVFLFDEKVLVIGSYDNSDPTHPYLLNCWISPLQFTSAQTESLANHVGRRVDQPESGAVTIRQVLVLESTFADLFLKLAYSTGTPGYNHATHDAFPYGFGWNLPGSLLGPEFDRSLVNLPGAEAPMVVVIDEVAKFADMFRDDLVIRWTFLRWRDQGFEFGQWKTPIQSLAAKSYAGTTLQLTEENKAEPSDREADHRIASEESDEHVRPIVKIDYCRDFGGSREAKYSRSVQIEDQRAVDDAGGGVKPHPLRMRHTFAQLVATGAPIEELLKEFIARFPLASKAGHRIIRTIDMRYWEGYGVGDIALVTDSFARDPITGTRGISQRPAMITKIAYNPGGPTSTGSVIGMSGEVELMFLDVQRGKEYAPTAEVDDTLDDGGLGNEVAGYTPADPSLTCYAHKYSHSIAGLDTRRTGTTIDDIEDADAEWFPAGSKIHIIEMDPDDPATALTWERTVLSQSGNKVFLTTTISAPAWDGTKKYRIVPQKYSQVVNAQQDVAYQADDADEMVEDEIPPWHYPASETGIDYEANAGTEKAEFIAEVAYGDGRPYDAGYDRALGHNFNAFHDYKSAHQSPVLVASQRIPQAEPTGDYGVLFIIPIHLGMDTLSSTVRRTLTVAPILNQGLVPGTTPLRVSIGQSMPVEAVTGEPTGAYEDPSFKGPFSQSAVWTNNTGGWVQGADAVLDINCKDVHFGHVFLLIEGGYGMTCRGLAKCVEGIRTVS